MAAKSGKGGSATIGALTPLLRAWTLDSSQSTLDVTGYAEAGARAVIAGISQWSGSAEGFIDASTDVDLAGALCSITLTDSQTTTIGQVRYAGNAVVSSISYGSSADGTCTVAITFDGSGALATTGVTGV